MELTDIFSKDLDHEKVHCVYGCPGHLFVTLNKGKQLKTYDVASPKKKLIRRRSLFLDISPSPVIQVSFFKTQNSPAFVAYQNGLVDVWSYTYNGSHGGWAKAGYFIICEKAEVSSILLDGEHGVVFWVERVLEDRQHSNRWCVKWRPLTIDPSSIDRPYTVGKATTILVNCPPCSLHQTHVAVCICPGSPSPPGLYFTWSRDKSDKSYLNTCVISQGSLQKTDARIALDLRAVAATYRHLWVKVADDPDYDIIANISCLSSGCVYLVSSNHKVHKITGTKESLHVCSIPDAINLSGARAFFVHRGRIAFVADQNLSFVNLETSEITQQIRISHLTSETDVYCWCILGNVPKYGIWCEDGIWILQKSAMDKLVTKDRQQTSDSNKSKCSRSQVTTHAQLEDLYHQFSKGKSALSDGGVQLTGLIGEDGLQSPALVLAALQNTTGGLQSEAQSVTHQLCELYGMSGDRGHAVLADTPLNKQVLPLLTQYWQTQKMLNQCLEKVDDKNAEMVTNVETDLQEILSEDSKISVELKRSEQSFLLTNWPEESLRILIRHLKIGNINRKVDINIQIPGPNDPDMNASHPMTKLAVEAPESACGLPLFEITCRLLFGQYPKCLIPFVEGAQLLRDRFRDVSAFTRKKHALQLCNLAIQSLPNKSLDTEERTKVRGQLLNMSGKTEYIQEALQLYLSKKMWGEAIELVKMHRQQTGQHSQMFHILLSAMIKEQHVFRQYNSKLWECAPDGLSALDLIQFVDQHHHSGSIRNQDVFCKPQDDLQLGQVKGQLLMMLSDEKNM